MERILAPYAAKLDSIVPPPLRFSGNPLVLDFFGNPLVLDFFAVLDQTL